jgi:hypothetical protein
MDLFFFKYGGSGCLRGCPFQANLFARTMEKCGMLWTQPCSQVELSCFLCIWLLCMHRANLLGLGQLVKSHAASMRMIITFILI